MPRPTRTSSTKPPFRIGGATKAPNYRFRIGGTRKFFAKTKKPAVVERLRPYKARLTERATRQAWYELRQPQLRYVAFLEGLKLVFPGMATEPRFTLDESGFYGSNTTYFVPGRDLYLLRLLNSRLAFLYCRMACAGLEGRNVPAVLRTIP